MAWLGGFVVEVGVLVLCLCGVWGFWLWFSFLGGFCSWGLAGFWLLPLLGCRGSFWRLVSACISG